MRGRATPCAPADRPAPASPPPRLPQVVKVNHTPNPEVISKYKVGCRPMAFFIGGGEGLLPKVWVRTNPRFGLGDGSVREKPQPTLPQTLLPAPPNRHPKRTATQNPAKPPNPRSTVSPP